MAAGVSGGIGGTQSGTTTPVSQVLRSRGAFFIVFPEADQQPPERRGIPYLDPAGAAPNGRKPPGSGRLPTSMLKRTMIR